LLLNIAKNTEVGFEHGASDARYLSVHGIDGIVWGADGEMSQHTADEHVLIDSILTVYETLEDFISRSQKHNLS
jgi:succinyl-diaminopimelate desuccinylase